MNTIKINASIANNYTYVPNWFIDEFMANSNGDFVKIYLILLRYISNQESSFSTNDCADKLNLTESDIVRALKFWANEGLIHLEIVNEHIMSITLIDPTAAEIATQETAAGLEGEQIFHINLSEKPQYTMDELSTFMSNTQYRDLSYITGRYLGKQLNQNDLMTLISFHDWLGLSMEVIEWLIEYCASNGHRNMRYIEKVAIEWADKEIDTIEKAKAYTDTYNKNYYAIKKALGFSNRNPVAYEIKLMDKWLSDFGFDPVIILEACERTMKQAPNGSFKYTDKILIQWHEKNVHTLSDIEKLDKQYTKKATVQTTKTQPAKNKFINFEQEDYDFEKIEKKALEMLLKENSEGRY